MPLWLHFICWGIIVGFTIFAFSLCKAASDEDDTEFKDYDE
jgi:hypothetical protein